MLISSPWPVAMLLLAGCASTQAPSSAERVPPEVHGQPRVSEQPEPARARVALEGTPEVAGALTVAQAQARIEQSLPAFLRCYERGLLERPGLTGVLGFKAIVGPKGVPLGRAVTFSTSESAFEAPRVQNCLGDVVLDWTFELRGSIAPITWQLRFTPGALSPEAPTENALPAVTGEAVVALVKVVTAKDSQLPDGTFAAEDAQFTHDMTQLGRALSGDFQACVDAQRARDPSLVEEFGLLVFVARDGTPQSETPGALSRSNDEEFKACLRTAARAAAYPHHCDSRWQVVELHYSLGGSERAAKSPLPTPATRSCPR